MDKISAQAYRQRWIAVEEVEKLEAQNASVETRWLQLNELVGMAIALGILPVEDREEEVVRARWLRIKGIT